MHPPLDRRGRAYGTALAPGGAAMSDDGHRFGAVPTAAIRDVRVTHAQLRVLAELSTYGDKHGWCFPKQELMAEHLGVTRENLNRHLAALRRLGYVETRPQRRSDGTRRSNQYRVIYDTSPGRQEALQCDGEHHTDSVTLSDTLNVTVSVTPQCDGEHHSNNTPSLTHPLPGAADDAEASSAPSNGTSTQQLVSYWVDFYREVCNGAEPPRSWKAGCGAAVKRALADHETPEDIEGCLWVCAQERKNPVRALQSVLADKHAGIPRRKR